MTAESGTYPPPWTPHTIKEDWYYGTPLVHDKKNMIRYILAQIKREKKGMSKFLFDHPISVANGGGCRLRSRTRGFTMFLVWLIRMTTPMRRRLKGDWCISKRLICILGSLRFAERVMRSRQSDETVRSPVRIIAVFIRAPLILTRRRRERGFRDRRRRHPKFPKSVGSIFTRHWAKRILRNVVMRMIRKLARVVFMRSVMESVKCCRSRLHLIEERPSCAVWIVPRLFWMTCWEKWNRGEMPWGWHGHVDRLVAEIWWWWWDWNGLIVESIDKAVWFLCPAVSDWIVLADHRQRLSIWHWYCWNGIGLVAPDFPSRRSCSDRFDDTFSLLAIAVLTSIAVTIGRQTPNLSPATVY